MKKENISTLLAGQQNEIIFVMLLLMADGKKLNNKTLTRTLTRNQIEGFYWWRNIIRMNLEFNLNPMFL